MINTLKIFFFSLNSNLQKKIYLFVTLSFIIGVIEMLGIGLIYPIANFLFLGNFDFINIFLKSNFLFKLSETEKAIFLVSFLFFFFLIKNIILIFINFYLFRILAEIRHGVSCDLFNKNINFDYDYFLNKNSGEITRNLTTLINDLNSNVILPFGILISELIILFFISIVVLFINFDSSLLMLIFFILPFFFYNKFLKDKLNFYGLNAQKNESLRIDKINQMIGGIKEIKILQKENFFTKWYKKYDFNVANSNRIVTTFTQTNKYLLEMILVLSISFLIFYQIYFLRNTNLLDLLPVLAVYTMAAFKVMPSLNRINTALQSIRWGSEVIKVTSNLLNKKPLSYFSKSKQQIHIFKRSIRFKNIFFRFNKSYDYILKNLNMTINKGETIGITGNSGSGKTTILNLLLGVLKPTSGDIFIDGVNQKYQNSTQHIIGYVPQDVFLLDSSILYNVAFGEDELIVDRNKAIRCLKDAKIYSFVSTLKDGINTKVGDRGIRLSGGQKQRIAIARSLYFGAQILIFDEATSALDYTTESEIMKTINNLDKRFTIILVAHRVNTLKQCDRIFVIENNKIKKQKKTYE